MFLGTTNWYDRKMRNHSTFRYSYGMSPDWDNAVLLRPTNLSDVVVHN